MTEEVITFKTYVDQRITDLEIAAIQRFDAQQLAIKDALINQEKAINVALVEKEKAIIKADLLTDKRFDSVNEAILKVINQTSDLLPRAEYAANHKALDDKIEVINSALNKTSSDKNLFVTIPELDTKLAQVVNRMETSLETLAASMKPIVDYVSQQKGATQGSQLTKAGIISAISITGVIIGIVVFIATSLIK